MYISAKSEHLGSALLRTQFMLELTPGLNEERQNLLQKWLGGRLVIGRSVQTLIAPFYFHCHQPP